MKSVAFTAPQTAELVDVPEFQNPPAPKAVRGRTLVSLISPGTELNWGYLGQKFPIYPGYACVFRIEEIGAEVGGLQIDDTVLTSGGHAEFQQADESSVVKIPACLAPEIAVFARLMGVSMSTLNTTAVRPPERVLVTGLGPVGNLAAQIFANCGYSVTASDPVAARRDSAAACGISDIRASVEEAGDLRDKIGLHVECSGHEKAVLDGCKLARKKGEVVLVGVPWKKMTDLSAIEILHAVFHRYVVLRSGWEWEVPVQPVAFAGNSLIENYKAALSWLAAGKIQTGGLATAFSPEETQRAYAGLLAQDLPTPGAYFNWNQ